MVAASSRRPPRPAAPYGSCPTATRPPGVGPRSRPSRRWTSPPTAARWRPSPSRPTGFRSRWPCSTLSDPTQPERVRGVRRQLDLRPVRARPTDAVHAQHLPAQRTGDVGRRRPHPNAESAPRAQRRLHVPLGRYLLVGRPPCCGRPGRRRRVAVGRVRPASAEPAGATEPRTEDTTGNSSSPLSSSILAVVLSPDENTLAAAGVDGPVQLWDVSVPTRPRRLGRPLTLHDDIVWRLAFTQDGRTLASGSEDTTIVLTDLTGLDRLRDDPAPPPADASAAASPAPSGLSWYPTWTSARPAPDPHPPHLLVRSPGLRHSSRARTIPPPIRSQPTRPP